MGSEDRPKFSAQSWENISDTTQLLWVNVKQWDYKVFPTLHGAKFGDWMFQFGGVCSRNTPLKGLKVTGEIEILESDEIPGGAADLEEHWENVPEHVEGFGHLVSIGDRTVAPFVGITLYFKASAFDWVYRAFAAGAFGTRSGVGIEIKIDCPIIMEVISGENSGALNGGESSHGVYTPTQNSQSMGPITQAKVEMPNSATRMYWVQT